MALVSLSLLPPDPFATAGLFVCFLAFLGVLQEFADGIRARRRVRTEPPLISLKQLLVRQGRRYGGYLVHVGIVCMGVAIVGNEFHQEVRHITLARGQQAEFGRWTVTYIGLTETEQANLTEYRAFVTVHDRRGNPVTRLEPRRNVYHKAPEAPTSEVGLHMSLPRRPVCGAQRVAGRGRVGHLLLLPQPFDDLVVDRRRRVGARHTGCALAARTGSRPPSPRMTSPDLFDAASLLRLVVGLIVFGALCLWVVWPVLVSRDDGEPPAAGPSDPPADGDADASDPGPLPPDRPNPSPE